MKQPLGYRMKTWGDWRSSYLGEDANAKNISEQERRHHYPAIHGFELKRRPSCKLYGGAQKEALSCKWCGLVVSSGSKPGAWKGLRSSKAVPDAHHDGGTLSNTACRWHELVMRSQGFGAHSSSLLL